MAAETRSGYSITPLNEHNFNTWKIQVKMALIREELWGFVNGQEAIPETTSANNKKYCSRKDRALSIIVMAIDPKLLYLIGDPEDPKVVFDTLSNIFIKKTWANKLRLRKRLYALRLSPDSNVHDLLKSFTEIFNDLAILGDVVEEEAKVIHLLASLPESYNTLVTALEAQESVPSWTVVAEKLLHEEQKHKVSKQDENALFNKASSSIKKKIICFFCGKPNHIKKIVSCS